MFLLRRPFARAAAGLVLALSLTGVGASRGAEAPPLYALIVGGGPDVENNAAQIEGHVRFVAGMLPAGAKHVLLFADGKADHASVTYADPSPGADARRALAVLLGNDDAAEPVLTHAPNLSLPMDGPSRLPEIRRALAKLSTQAAQTPAPLLLYFAGHGSQDEKNEASTSYDLWDRGELKVHVLAAEVARLPRQTPTVLVMAQCFSGAFADLLFRNGDPKGALAEGNLAGFFSARKDREAAGCSYQVEREDYQDFSSYFFGALCGRDRFGGAVGGADFDGDGTVSLHEAFCYALIHDASPDTPVCTSDAFLRRFAPLPEAVFLSMPYPEVWQAGTAAQRAALDALSAQLGLDGQSRALAVYDRLNYYDPIPRAPLMQSQHEAKAKLNAVRQTALGTFFGRWPVLRWDSKMGGYQQAFDGAMEELVKDQTLRRALLEAEKAHEQADGAVMNEEAALQRFASLYEHIAEAKALRARGKAETKAQFERLWKTEQSTLPVAAR